MNWRNCHAPSASAPRSCSSDAVGFGARRQSAAATALSDGRRMRVRFSDPRADTTRWVEICVRIPASSAMDGQWPDADIGPGPKDNNDTIAKT